MRWRCVLSYTCRQTEGSLILRHETNSRKLIRLLTDDGWTLIGSTGDHHHFKHPSKPGKVTVPHPNKDIPIGTVVSIYWQAGWRKRGEQ